MLFPRIRILEGPPQGWWNADHSGWRVTIYRNIECFAAVLAQEIYECRYLACRGFFVPQVLAAMQREMELRGHTVEAVAAARFYGKDFDAYLAKEARVATSYPQFKGWDAARVEAEMRKRLPLAEAWVEAHANLLRSMDRSL